MIAWPRSRAEELLHLGLLCAAPYTFSATRSRTLSNGCIAGGRQRLELEDLEALRRADRLRHVARLHLVEQVLQRGRELLRARAGRSGRRWPSTATSTTSAATLAKSSPVEHARADAPRPSSAPLRPAATLTPACRLASRSASRRDLAQRDRGGLGELRLVRGVILARLFLGDLQLLIRPRPAAPSISHLPLELLAQVVHRHAFLRRAPP